jgi:hypothetical protein
MAKRSSGALLRLPPRLMAIATRNRQPRLGAIQAQLAVAIEILLMAPMRIGNLVSLDLERNLVRPGHGKTLHIVIEAKDVKNREPLEYPLPAQSVELIDRYIRDFRPRLAPASSTALFPGEQGKPKRRKTLGKQISFGTIQLKNGLRTLLGAVSHKTGKPYDTAQLYVGTVHSLCSRLLLDRRLSPGRARTHAPILLDELSQYLFLLRQRNWNAVQSAGPLKVTTINSVFENSYSTSRFRAIANL